jgi:uncharacterized protein
MDVENDGGLAAAQATSKARAAALMAALDPALDARDDAIQGQLARENSSAKSKLGKVYRLVDVFAEAARPFVACAEGCSACCKMNVSITSVEAQRLAAATGRPLATVREPVEHDLAEFSGVPCPFLVNDVCSAYEERPYVCRAHFSFDTSSYWCQPERAHAAPMKFVGLGGARNAYAAITVGTAMGGLADIRDFFPL